MSAKKYKKVSGACQTPREATRDPPSTIAASEIAVRVIKRLFGLSSPESLISTQICKRVINQANRVSLNEFCDWLGGFRSVGGIYVPWRGRHERAWRWCCGECRGRRRYVRCGCCCAQTLFQCKAFPTPPRPHRACCDHRALP